MSLLCRELHQLFNSVERFTYPYQPARIPLTGVYVLFEEGEGAHGGGRIVRVGSHSGRNNLRNRLAEHYLNENKDRSIFRKNIGRALLNRDGDPFLDYWEIDMTYRKNKDRYGSEIDWDKQQRVEERVSDYIRNRISFAVLRIGDEAKEEIEARIIATVSNCGACRPSDTWLGRHSPKPKIRESGLWQEQHLYKQSISRRQLEQLYRIAGTGTSLLFCPAVIYRLWRRFVPSVTLLPSSAHPTVAVP